MTRAKWVRTLAELDATRDLEEGGAKACLLARAAALGLRVPPAFVVSRAATSSVDEPEVQSAILAALARLEEGEGVALGRGLTVSVRPSNDQLAPGALPTILDVGACAAAREALTARLGDEGAYLDARARFLRGLGRARSPRAGESPSRAAGMRGGRPGPSVTELGLEIATLEATLGLGESTSALDELWHALRAVASYGVPVIVQAMRFGNAAGISGAGTASSRHPITGEPVVFGEIAWGKQGEDLSLGRGAGVSMRRAAAGRRGDESLEARAPGILDELSRIAAALERALDHVVDLEITIEAATLWLLQVRETVLTPRAEMRTLVDRVREGALSEDEALARLRVESMARVGRVELVEESLAPGAILGRGLGASPGAATGIVAIDVDDALIRAARGTRVVLVRSDASPEDAPAVRAAVAVATASGGLTSHAAVMSRALGRPCAVSVSSLRVRADCVTIEGRGERLAPGDVVTVDGTRGLLVRGVAPVRWVTEEDAARELARWARARTDRIVLVAESRESAEALEADGTWSGAEARDLAGTSRPDWGVPEDWGGPPRPLPTSRAVLVVPSLVAAARAAAVVSSGLQHPSDSSPTVR